MNCPFDIHIDKNSSEAIYLQIYSQLKLAIQEGVLSDSEKLPPIRTMKETLGVNAATVVSAYSRLERDGLVYKRVGSGTYVRSIKEQVAASEAIDFTSQVDHKGESELSSVIDMRASVIPESSFPVEEFKQAIDIVIQRDKGGAFAYQDVMGYLPLREALAEHLAQVSKIEVMPSEIIILSGAQQGLDLIAESLLGHGDIAITESPAYLGASGSFMRKGAQVVEVPVNEEGIDYGILKKNLQMGNVKLVYTTPNCQYPTGLVYSRSRKDELIKLCSVHGAYIIEDDHLGELGLKPKHSRPLKAMDRDDRVIYIKSFSKTVMPGIRLALMLAPKHLISKIVNAKSLSDLSGSGIIQRAFEHMLSSGTYDGQIESQRVEFKWRRALAQKAISRHLKRYCDTYSSVAGLSFWLRLKRFSSARRLVSLLKKRGVLILSGDSFSISKRDGPYFRISVYGLEDDKIINGIYEVARAIRDLENMDGIVKNV